MPFQPHPDDPIPTSRVYLHLRCGGGTAVSGHDFVSLCDPARPVSGTMCVTCGDCFPLDQFVWADTEETLQDCRSRWFGRLAPAERLLVGGWMAVPLPAACAVPWYVVYGLLESGGTPAAGWRPLPRPYGVGRNSPPASTFSDSGCGTSGNSGRERVEVFDTGVAPNDRIRPRLRADAKKCGLDGHENAGRSGASPEKLSRGRSRHGECL